MLPRHDSGAAREPRYGAPAPALPRWGRAPGTADARGLDNRFSAFGDNLRPADGGKERARLPSRAGAGWGTGGWATPALPRAQPNFASVQFSMEEVVALGAKQRQSRQLTTQQPGLLPVPPPFRRRSRAGLLYDMV